MTNTSSSGRARTNLAFLKGVEPPSAKVLLWCTLITLMAAAAFTILEQQRGQGKANRAAVPSMTSPGIDLGKGSATPIGSFDARDIKPLSAPEAIAINAAIPVVSGAGPESRPFVIGSAKTVFRANALQCLTAALYYEAGSEPDDGQRAVAQVILNRMRHPAYPASVCGVVYQGSTRATGCQFTFTCDGSFRRTPSARGWARSRRLAEEALSGRIYAPVGYATHYHADYVVPYWAASLHKAATVGRHIFYRWPGRNGTAPAFRQRYAEVELIPSVIADAELAEADSLARDVTTIELGGSEVEQLVTPIPPSSSATDDLARSKAAIAEDARVQSSLLADTAAGTLKLAPGRATAAVNQPSNQDAACQVNKRASPIEPSRDARVSGSMPAAAAGCP